MAQFSKSSPYFRPRFVIFRYSFTDLASKIILESFENHFLNNHKLWLFTIYLGKPFGSWFGQLHGK